MSIRLSIVAAFAILVLTCSTAHAEHYAIPLFPAPGVSGDPQGVLRIVNDTGEAATVQVYAIADDGTRAGPATIALGASAAAEFDATELRSANAAKGLSGGLGSISGDVRLTIDSDAPIVPLAFVRASDGTLSAMHDTVRSGKAEEGEYRYDVPIFNLSTAVAQASRLRLINAGDTSAAVTIEGRDDGATATGGTVRLTLPAGGARTLTAQQLEAGGTGLTGQLGAGIGRWRLTVSSDQALRVVNIVESSTGHWNNLSTTAVRGAAPADRAGFDDRFVGETAVLEADAGRSSLTIMENGRFSDTQSDDGMAATFEGDYDYAGLGPDAGRLTLDYDDGTRCEANVYFSSRTSGWFASHCTGGPGPETRSGGDWFVGEEEDDGGGGAPVETTYGTGEALPGVPTSELFDPADLSGGSVQASGGSTTIGLNNGGYFELDDGTRYTCASAGGCEIVDGTVTRGSVTGRAAASGGGETDRFPVFPAAGRPGDRTYTVGLAIDALTLPEATGGNPPLTYSLSPDVPGLSFDAVARSLTGTPTVAGSYAMSYTVTDVDGDLYTFRFNIEVGAGDADDHGDAFDTATTVSIPSTTPGELEEGKEDGDRDYFRVILAAATTLTVETTGNTDTFGTLFDGGRTQLATNDDSGSGRNFRIERQLQAGTYYVEVRGYRPSSTGSYELRVSGADDPGGGGDDGQTTFGVGDTLTDLPTGVFGANVRGGSIRFSGGNSIIDLNNGGHFEYGNYRYTCQTSGGCMIENRRVTAGTVVQSASSTVPGGGGTGTDAQPSFAAGSNPGDQSYTVGTAIDALTLPVAGGGDGSLSYSLTPEVPGLIFNATATVRRLTGTPTTAGTYDMTYRVRDVDGDTDTLNFTIVVASQREIQHFRLDRLNGAPRGIVFANDRFYVADWHDDKVYAYHTTGERDAASDYNLISNIRRVSGIAFANDRFYVVDFFDNRVHAFHASGERDAASDFNLASGNHRWNGIAFGNDRLYVLNQSQDRVYAYHTSGERDSASDFDLHPDNREPVRIEFANGKLHVVDAEYGLVYAYGVSGERALESDQFLNPDIGSPTGITFANERFYVVDDSADRVYVLNSADPSPDLVVSSFSVSTARPLTQQSIEFDATVLNRGTAISAATTLRFYSSTDSTISTDDTEIETHALGALSHWATDNATITLTAPEASGTYYYGACVGSVPGEPYTENNCSSAERVTVRGRVPDLSFESVSVSDDTPGSQETFVFTASVRNNGTGASPATTLRVYRSDERSISTGDTHVGTDAVSELAVDGASTHSVTLPAPMEAGTYYYGACVDDVAEESNTANNCSSAVPVFGGGPFPEYDLVVSSATLHNPSSGNVGQSFDMSVTVTNRGPNRSQPAKLRFGSGSYRDVPALDTGESTTIRSRIGSISIGTTTYRACIVEAPGEVETSNNCTSRSVTYL